MISLRDFLSIYLIVSLYSLLPPDIYFFSLKREALPQTIILLRRSKLSVFIGASSSLQTLLGRIYTTHGHTGTNTNKNTRRVTKTLRPRRPGLTFTTRYVYICCADPSKRKNFGSPAAHSTFAFYCGMN